MAASVIAGAALAYGVYAGERANSAANEARKRQRTAQAEALRIQMIERQRSVQQEMKAANRPSPSSTIALNESLLNPTDRTGGIDDRLRLSRTSKLGGG